MSKTKEKLEKACLSMSEQILERANDILKDGNYLKVNDLKTLSEITKTMQSVIITAFETKEEKQTVLSFNITDKAKQDLDQLIKHTSQSKLF